MGIDIGGTFTDVAAIDAEGVLHTGKRLTTAGAEHEGVLQAASDSDLPLTSVGVLVHGTTLVINALLERKGALTALVTTKGFRDVHELARGNRPEIFNPFYRRDAPLVPRELRFEISERVNASGEIETEPSESDLAELAERLRASGVEAVAVACLNAYLEPASEKRIADYLAAALPGVAVTASAAISRQWREYERTTTACANAYTMPTAARYLGELTSGLSEDGFAGDFLLLDSDGGALPQTSAMQFPIKAVESGPVGGALAARALADQLGLSNVVTFDMGGTTAKACLLEGGRLVSTDLYWIGGYERGFPVQTPSIDIVEVGAGGGSIAWVDEAGRLRVGPRSAGAAPGPASYGLGGDQATVTDANVYCGRVSAESFVGKLDLHPERAEVAITRLAERLAMDADRLAVGILELANLSMSAAVRRQTVERGRDPREFAMVAFGGAGPMHACEVARQVGIARVIIPPAPGVFSAIGMLMANMRLRRREIFLSPLAEITSARLAPALKSASLEMSRIEGLGETGADDIRETYALALRYRGQEHTVEVQSPFAALDVGPNAAEAFLELFSEEYERRFGHLDELSTVEVVEIAVERERVLPSRVPRAAAADGRGGRSFHTSVLWGYATERSETPFVPRHALTVGDRIDGPAVIYEDGSHTVMPPRTKATVLPAGALEIGIEE